MAIFISTATTDQIPTIVSYVMAARAKMFPMLDSRILLTDLANFQHTYMDHPDGCFLTAHADGQLVATIGYLAYDPRFPQLNLGRERVVEVVRLYVDPLWRRAGLASMLFDHLLHQARQAGIERFYLHTHPFLPGAIRFWERQGFSILDIEKDPVWRTTHMTRLCTPPPDSGTLSLDIAKADPPSNKLQYDWIRKSVMEVNRPNCRGDIERDGTSHTLEIS